LLWGKIRVYKKVREAKNKAGREMRIGKINGPLAWERKAFPKRSAKRAIFLGGWLSRKKKSNLNKEMR